MKYILLFIILVPAYYAIPFVDIVAVQLSLVTAQGEVVEGDSKAVFVDADNQPIDTIMGKKHLVWWVHTRYPEKTDGLSPSQALEAVSVIISVDGCADKRVLLNIISEYESLIFSLRGFSGAYMYHHLGQDIIMDCPSKILNEQDNQ